MSNQKSIFSYITDNSLYIHKHSCSSFTPPFKNTVSSRTPSQNVDIEADLKGLTRFLSKCTSEKYQGKSNTQALIENKKECPSELQILPQGYLLKKL